MQICFENDVVYKNLNYKFVFLYFVNMQNSNDILFAIFFLLTPKPLYVKCDHFSKSWLVVSNKTVSMNFLIIKFIVIKLIAYFELANFKSMNDFWIYFYSFLRLFFITVDNGRVIFCHINMSNVLSFYYKTVLLNFRPKYQLKWKLEYKHVVPCIFLGIVLLCVHRARWYLPVPVFVKYIFVMKVSMELMLLFFCLFIKNRHIQIFRFVKFLSRKKIKKYTWITTRWTGQQRKQMREHLHMWPSNEQWWI